MHTQPEPTWEDYDRTHRDIMHRHDHLMKLRNGNEADRLLWLCFKIDAIAERKYRPDVMMQPLVAELQNDARKIASDVLMRSKDEWTNPHYSPLPVLRVVR